jgi:hypothetical protein
MDVKNNFLEVVENRRSFYGISKESILSKEEIKKIIEHAVKFAPTAFNSQSGRVVLLVEKEHDCFWEEAKIILEKIVGEENFEETKQKINAFQAGYGTVLFFEDQKVVESLQAQYSIYKDNFPVWSLQSSGMLQYIVWAALEEVGLGASLQHYNPLVDKKVQENWGVPTSWKLVAQMPFGKPTGKPNEKEFLPIQNRVKMFG